MEFFLVLFIYSLLQFIPFSRYNLACLVFFPFLFSQLFFCALLMHCKNVTFLYWIIPARLITVQPFSNSDKHKLLNRQREKAWGDIFFPHHQFFFNSKAYSLLFSWFFISIEPSRALLFLTIVKSCSHSLHFKILYTFLCVIIEL